MAAADLNYVQLKFNQHLEASFNNLAYLRDKQVYTDLTLSCCGQFYPAHRLVVSSCSEYLARSLQTIPAFCPYPIILLDGLEKRTLEALLTFMYDGVVAVHRDHLAHVLKAGHWLGIKGLTQLHASGFDDETLPESATDNDTNVSYTRQYDIDYNNIDENVNSSQYSSNNNNGSIQMHVAGINEFPIEPQIQSQALINTPVPVIPVGHVQSPDAILTSGGIDHTSTPVAAVHRNSSDHVTSPAMQHTSSSAGRSSVRAYGKQTQSEEKDKYVHTHDDDLQILEPENKMLSVVEDQNVVDKQAKGFVISAVEKMVLRKSPKKSEENNVEQRVDQIDESSSDELGNTDSYISPDLNNSQQASRNSQKKKRKIISPKKLRQLDSLTPSPKRLRFLETNSFNQDAHSKKKKCDADTIVPQRTSKRSSGTDSSSKQIDRVGKSSSADGQKSIIRSKRLLSRKSTRITAPLVNKISDAILQEMNQSSSTVNTSKEALAIDKNKACDHDAVVIVPVKTSTEPNEDNSLQSDPMLSSKDVDNSKSENFRTKSRDSKSDASSKDQSVSAKKNIGDENAEPAIIDIDNDVVDEMYVDDEPEDSDHANSSGFEGWSTPNRTSDPTPAKVRSLIVRRDMSNKARKVYGRRTRFGMGLKSHVRPHRRVNVVSSSTNPYAKPYKSFQSNKRLFERATNALPKSTDNININVNGALVSKSTIASAVYGPQKRSTISGKSNINLQPVPSSLTSRSMSASSSTDVSIPQPSASQISVPKPSVSKASIPRISLPKTSTFKTSAPMTSTNILALRSAANQPSVFQTSVVQISTVQASVTQTLAPQNTIPQTSALQISSGQVSAQQSSVPDTPTAQASVSLVCPVSTSVATSAFSRPAQGLPKTSTSSSSPWLQASQDSSFTQSMTSLSFIKSVATGSSPVVATLIKAKTATPKGSTTLTQASIPKVTEEKQVASSSDVTIIKDSNKITSSQILPTLLKSSKQLQDNEGLKAKHVLQQRKSITVSTINRTDNEEIRFLCRSSKLVPKTISGIILPKDVTLSYPSSVTIREATTAVTQGDVASSAISVAASAKSTLSVSKSILILPKITSVKSLSKVPMPNTSTSANTTSAVSESAAFVARDARDITCVSTKANLVTGPKIILATPQTMKILKKNLATSSKGSPSVFAITSKSSCLMTATAPVTVSTPSARVSVTTATTSLKILTTPGLNTEGKKTAESSTVSLSTTPSKSTPVTSTTATLSVNIVSPKTSSVTSLTAEDAMVLQSKSTAIVKLKLASSDIPPNISRTIVPIKLKSSAPVKLTTVKSKNKTSTSVPVRTHESGSRDGTSTESRAVFSNVEKEFVRSDGVINKIRVPSVEMSPKIAKLKEHEKKDKQDQEKEQEEEHEQNAGEEEKEIVSEVSSRAQTPKEMREKCASVEESTTTPAVQGRGQRTLHCKICKRPFTDSAQLLRHSLNHDERKVYFCDTCKDCFKTCDDYITHMQQQHVGDASTGISESAGNSSVKLKTYSASGGETLPEVASGGSVVSAEGTSASKIDVSALLSCPYCDFTTRKKIAFIKHTDGHVELN